MWSKTCRWVPWKPKHKSAWCKNCKNVSSKKFSWDPSLARKCRAQTVRMLKSMRRQANDRKITMEKGKISPKGESWPFVFSRTEKVYCEISPKLPMLTSLHSVQSVNASAAATSGRKTSPFFIVQGKKVMARWFDPLPAESYGAHVLTENNWFPSNGAVKMSEKGSMTRDIIPYFYSASG